MIKELRKLCSYAWVTVGWVVDVDERSKSSARRTPERPGDDQRAHSLGHIRLVQ
jgi:hypothetical protein